MCNRKAKPALIHFQTLNCQFECKGKGENSRLFNKINNNVALFKGKTIDLSGESSKKVCKSCIVRTYSNYRSLY